MADFPYSYGIKKLSPFFSHIQSAAIPDKMHQQYLKKAGFTSSYDSAIIPLFKFIGFLDSSGVPTKLWREYRDKSKAGKVLASALKDSYNELFSLFPDAHRKDTEALRNYFSAHTTKGESVLTAIVSTFKTLCTLSDFDTAEITAAIGEELQKLPEEGKLHAREVLREYTININIQLQLPSTENALVYEKLFEALKKHLLFS